MSHDLFFSGGIGDNHLHRPIIKTNIGNAWSPHEYEHLPNHDLPSKYIVEEVGIYIIEI